MDTVLKVLKPVLAAGTTAAGVATANPALIASGGSELVGSLASDFAGQQGLKLPPPKPPPSTTAAPFNFPAPDLQSVGGGIAPNFSSTVTSGGPGGAGGGGDQSALQDAVMQAIASISGGGTGGNPFGGFGS